MGDPNRMYWQHWRMSDVVRDGDKHGEAELHKATATGLTAFRFAMHGANVREGDTAVQLVVGGQLWMSDTRDEFNDHLGAIYAAKGRVLVHGLGLGCYLNAILHKDMVSHVDVVERNADVVALMSPYFESYAKAGKLTIHHDDAFTHKWPKGTRWQYVWHDIWPTICTDDLPEHTKLMRKFGHRCNEQGAWKHEHLLWQKKQEKRSFW